MRSFNKKIPVLPEIPEKERTPLVNKIVENIPIMYLTRKPLNICGLKSYPKKSFNLIDKPDDSAVTMANILLPHREQTIRRMKAEGSVLCIQDDNRPASAIPIEEKKTFSWIEGVRDCQGLKALMPHTSIINVMDREGDFFEMFDVLMTHRLVIS